MLYLVNDLLHHTTYNEPSDGVFAEEVDPFLADLFVAAMYPGAIKQLAKLEKLQISGQRRVITQSHLSRT